MKKPLCLALVLALATTLIPAAFAPQPPLITDTYVWATIAEPQYADPAAAYDAAGGYLLNNVYEHLIFPDEEETTKFVPQLAENWTVSPDGLTWTFKIRNGVKFHDGAVLIPEDVEYSYERMMVMDFSSGPAWMFLDPLLGIMTTSDYDLTNETQAIELGQKIDAAVESTSDSVIFQFAAPYPATTWLQILCNYWASVLNKAWAVEHGSWPGEWGDYTEWVAYNNPTLPPFDDPQPVLMGTGPYKIDYWEKTVEYSLIKFDEYWGGWPAPGVRGSVNRIIVKTVTEWPTRKLMFFAGDVDVVEVPRSNILELNDTAGVALPGINCFRGMPTGALDAVFFTQNINNASTYIGSGQLDGDGIPYDFFNDVHVRKAFAYAFDFGVFLQDAYLGEGTQPTTCMPMEAGYIEWVNPEQEKYSLNLANAEAEFKLAWGGQVWEKGFRCTLVYNSGNTMRKTACDILAANLAALNPKFRIESIPVDWPTFLSARTARTNPINVLGWHHDFADPHNWFMPFMHSAGDFAFFSGYSNPSADELIETGIREVDTQKRLDIYYELQQIYFDEVPCVPISSTFQRRYERTWVAGWYSNNLIGTMGCRYNQIWKQIVEPNTGYPVEDVVQDGKINIVDISTQAKAFGANPGHPRWMASIRADVDRNAVVNIVDLAKVAKKFGTTIPTP